MSLQPKTFNTQHPTSNSAIARAASQWPRRKTWRFGVECSMFVREISRRAKIWPDSRVAAGILPAVAGDIPADWHHENGSQTAA